MKKNFHVGAWARELVARRSDWHCVYCGIKIEKFGLGSNEGQIDHIIPRVKNGSNHWKNLVLSCRSCNTGKSGRDLRLSLLRKKFIEMGAPRSIQIAHVEWIDKTFGPIEITTDFWMDRNELKDISDDDIKNVESRVGNTKNRSRIPHDEIVRRVMSGERVSDVAMKAGIRVQRIYQIVENAKRKPEAKERYNKADRKNAG